MAMGARGLRAFIAGFVECEEDVEEQKLLEKKKSWSSVTLSTGSFSGVFGVTPLGKQLRASRSVNHSCA